MKCLRKYNIISLILSIFYVKLNCEVGMLGLVIRYQKLNCEVGMLGLNKTVEWERLASIKLWSGKDWLRETITRSDL
ncbi:hypothetical protein V1477_018632 [Vespula maculifrons]|uniref:Uncharacterized protein n=1 Tax=Vespula maculifrons TaxID=7453 RepID=A0ABD2AVX5_VESMC